MISPLYCPHCYTPLAFPVDRCPSCHKSTGQKVEAIPRDTLPHSPFDPSQPLLSPPETSQTPPPKKSGSAHPLHTLDVPAVPKKTKTAQQTQPSSPWAHTAPSVPRAQEYLLPDESEFPTTLAPSRDLLAFTEFPPNTVQDLPIVPPLSPPPIGNRAWSQGEFLAPSAPTDPGQGNPRDTMLPSVREVLLPLEEEEPTMAAHLDDVFVPNKNANFEATEQALTAVPSIQPHLLDLADHSNPLFFLPPDTKEYVHTATTDPAGVASLSEPVHLSVAPPASGDDTFDHLLHDLGMPSSVTSSDEDNDGDAFGVWSADLLPAAAQEKSLHTLEQTKPDGLSSRRQELDPAKSTSEFTDSSPSLSSVPLRSSFSPVSRSESNPDNRAVNLRLRNPSGSTELSAVSPSSELSAAQPASPRPTSRKKSSSRPTPHHPKSAVWLWLLHLTFWTVLLTLLLGAGFLSYRYLSQAKIKSQKIKPATLHFNDILKD